MQQSRPTSCVMLIWAQIHDALNQTMDFFRNITNMDTLQLLALAIKRISDWKIAVACWVRVMFVMPNKLHAPLETRHSFINCKVMTHDCFKLIMFFPLLNNVTASTHLSPHLSPFICALCANPHLGWPGNHDKRQDRSEVWHCRYWGLFMNKVQNRAWKWSVKDNC